eukprot:14228389-Alexandrium_andersonii.AAC.1
MARRTVEPSAWRVGNTAGAPLPRARRWLSWEATGAGGGASSVCSALGVASPLKPGGPAAGRGEWGIGEPGVPAAPGGPGPGGLGLAAWWLAVRGGVEGAGLDGGASDSDSVGRGGGGSLWAPSPCAP